MIYKKVFWLIFLICFSCGSLSANDLQGEHEFELSWQGDGFWYEIYAAEYKDKFEKEPEGVGEEALRFRVKLADKKKFNLLWDKDHAGLYLDLDCDGDLSNDPNGFFKADSDNHRHESYTFQRFEGKEICFVNKAGTKRYKADFEFTQYSNRYQNAQIKIHSGYSGVVELGGKKRQIAMIDTLSSNQPGGVLRFAVTNCYEEGEIDYEQWVAPQGDVFLGGKNYKFSYELVEKGSDSNMVVRLKEEPVEMGRLRVVGDHIHRLIFIQGNRYIFSELSGEVEDVPVGDLRCWFLQLKADGKIVRAKLDNIVVSCGSNGVAEFKAGGPLNNSVSVRRCGGILNFDYKLVGQAGERYSVRSIALNNSKPSFVVYKGDMQVGGGNFEYG